MSDDPARIEAWKQQDIVTRLRCLIHYDRSVELMNREAADEIERLRARIAELEDDRIQLGGGALQRFMENPDD